MTGLFGFGKLPNGFAFGVSVFGADGNAPNGLAFTAGAGLEVFGRAANGLAFGVSPSFFPGVAILRSGVPFTPSPGLPTMLLNKLEVAEALLFLADAAAFSPYGSSLSNWASALRLLFGVSEPDGVGADGVAVAGVGAAFAGVAALNIFVFGGAAAGVEEPNNGFCAGGAAAGVDEPNRLFCGGGALGVVDPDSPLVRSYY